MVFSEPRRIESDAARRRINVVWPTRRRACIRADYPCWEKYTSCHLFCTHPIGCQQHTSSYTLIIIVGIKLGHHTVFGNKRNTAASLLRSSINCMYTATVTITCWLPWPGSNKLSLQETHSVTAESSTSLQPVTETRWFVQCMQQ